MALTLAGETTAADDRDRYAFYSVAAGSHTLMAALPAGLAAAIGPVTTTATRGAAVGSAATMCLDFNSNGRTDVQDIMQVAARWNNPAAYDPTYDVAPPFGSPIDIQDIMAIAGQWDSACQ